MNPQRVLVTGGAGFIGTNLVRSLRARGFTTWCFDNFSTGARQDAERSGYDEVIEGDLLDLAALTDAVRGCDYVVHLGAQAGVPASVADPLHDAEVNVIGTLNALTAARDADIKGFVLASSNAPLGEVEPPAHEGIVPRPISPYGASKLSGEAYCSAFAGSYGLPTVALRFANVYGPYSYHKGSVIAQWCNRLLAGEPLVVYGDGNQTRDFTYVDDICDGIVAAMLSGARGAIAHLGTGVEAKVIDVAHALLANAQRTSPGIEFRPPRRGDIVRNCADISRARELFGYQPSVALDEGLERTVSWFEESAAA